MEEANKIITNVAIAVVLLFASILLAFVGMTITMQKTNDDIGLMDGKISGFALVYRNIQDSVDNAVIKIDNILEKLGVIEASTLGIKSVCAYKMTPTATGNTAKNCNKLTTKMGYGLVDCPTQGITTYYCNGKISTKAQADCCNPNINTGKCS